MTSPDSAAKASPGPSSLPILGHALHFLKGEGGCTYDAFLKIALRFGDYVPLRIPGNTFLIVSDPTVLKEIYVERTEDFPKGDTIAELKAIGLGSTGLTEVEGEEWAVQRKMLMHLYKPTRIAPKLPDINSAALKGCESLKAFPEIEIGMFMSTIVLAITMKTTFGVENDALDDLSRLDPFLDRQNKATDEFLKRLQRGKHWKSLPIPSNRRFREGIQEQKNYFEAFIVQHEKNPELYPDTVLGQLLAAFKEKGEVPTRDHIYDQMQTLLGGGLESVGYSLHWLFYYLAQNPKVEAGIYDEVMSVLGDTKMVELEHTKKMPLLLNAISETLRLRPPFPLNLRQAANDDKLGGFPVKKGTWVITLNQRMQTSEKYWGKNAAEFDPSRFTEGNPPEESKVAYVPFGIGPRICLGKRMAELELIIIAAQIVRQYRFELKPNQKITPFMKFSWASKNGIEMKVHRRAVVDIQK